MNLRTGKSDSRDEHLRQQEAVNATDSAISAARKIARCCPWMDEGQRVEAIYREQQRRELGIRH